MSIKHRLKKLEQLQLKSAKCTNMILMYKNLVRFNGVDYSKKDFEIKYPHLIDDRDVTSRTILKVDYV